MVTFVVVSVHLALVFLKTAFPVPRSQTSTTLQNTESVFLRGGGGGEGAGRGGGKKQGLGPEKRCPHNLYSDPLGSGFKKGRENVPQ